MTGFQDLEGQLLDAIERRGSRRARRAAAIVVAASSALVLAVVAFAIVALGHGKPPAPPARPAVAGVPSPRELTEISSARQAVLDRDPTCTGLPRDLGAGATISEGTPSATMLSVLGVLRRPATAADRLPARFYRNGHLMIARIARGIYVRYIRRARVVNGVSYYIVPAAGVNVPAFSARCDAETIAMLRRQLSKASARVRVATLASAEGMFAREHFARITEAVFAFDFGHGSGGGEGGITPGELARQGLWGSDGAVLHGIVPDGVARVTLEYPAHGNVRTVRTVAVVDNLFVVRGPSSEPVVPKIIWRAANGRVIRVVKHP